MSTMNLTLLTDFYELTMMQGYFKTQNTEKVVFDAFYRKNPCDGGYAIAAGLDQVIDYIKNLRFSKEDIAYLRSLNTFDEDFLNYLADFRFSGDIYAIPEGTVVQGGCPDHGGTAGRDCHSDDHQSPESDCYKSFPCCLCCKR